MIGKTNAITSAGSDDILRMLIEREITSFKIPKGTTKIGAGAFSYCDKFTSIEIPNSVTTIGKNAFEGIKIPVIEIPGSVKTLEHHTFANTNIETIVLNEGLTCIAYSCFQYTTLKEITLPSTITRLETDCFRCEIQKINIPKALTFIWNNPFTQANKLEFVTIEDGFNCNNLNLSASTLYTAETIVSWIEALADRNGLEPYVLTIGVENQNKLTPEQRAIATAKNWTLA